MQRDNHQARAGVQVPEGGVRHELPLHRDIGRQSRLVHRPAAHGPEAGRHDDQRQSQHARRVDQRRVVPVLPPHGQQIVTPRGVTGPGRKKRVSTLLLMRWTRSAGRPTSSRRKRSCVLDRQMIRREAPAQHAGQPVHLPLAGGCQLCAISTCAGAPRFDPARPQRQRQGDFFGRGQPGIVQAAPSPRLFRLGDVAGQGVFQAATPGGQGVGDARVQHVPAQRVGQGEVVQAGPLARRDLRRRVRGGAAAGEDERSAGALSAIGDLPEDGQGLAGAPRPGEFRRLCLPLRRQLRSQTSRSSANVPSPASRPRHPWS